MSDDRRATLEARLKDLRDKGQRISSKIAQTETELKALTAPKAEPEKA